jgi:acetyltransferase-like isoleucine patch superfamily enzyme
MSYLSLKAIKKLDLAYVGMDVQISDKCIINNPQETSIGDYSRIDDLTILSGKVTLGKYVHIAVMNNIAGGKFGVSIGNCVGIAYGCNIFSQTDDYTGNSLVSPLFPSELTSVSGGKITICDFSTIGTGAIIFPKVTLREGSAIGAMSLVNKDTDSWGIYVGNPAKRVKERSKLVKEIYDKNFN